MTLLDARPARESNADKEELVMMVDPLDGTATPIMASIVSVGLGHPSMENVTYAWLKVKGRLLPTQSLIRQV